MMTVERAKLRYRVTLLGLDQGGVAPGAQHLARGIQEATQPLSIEALQCLQFVLSGAVSKQQVGGCGEELLGSLINAEVHKRTSDDGMDVFDIAFRFLPSGRDYRERTVRQGSFDERGAEVGNRPLRAEKDALRHHVICGGA
jgi:hypothetical protein